jgi:hypothetical protein
MILRVFFKTVDYTVKHAVRWFRYETADKFGVNSFKTSFQRMTWANN